MQGMASMHADSSRVGCSSLPRLRTAFNGVCGTDAPETGWSAHSTLILGGFERAHLRCRDTPSSPSSGPVYGGPYIGSSLVPMHWYVLRLHGPKALGTRLLRPTRSQCSLVEAEASALPDGELEGEAAATGTLEPAISTIALAGILSTTCCALVLLRLCWLVETDALSVDRAETVIRIEDAVLTVAIATGVSFTVAGVTLSLIGLATPELAISLYDAGVAIYAQGSGLFAIDTRITSGLAFVAALGILLGYLFVTGERTRRRASVDGTVELG